MTARVDDSLVLTVSMQRIDFSLEEIIMFSYINKLINKIKKSEKGQGMVEYALIIAFVAAIAIYVLNTGLRGGVEKAFENASNAVTSASDVAGKSTT